MFGMNPEDIAMVVSWRPSLECYSLADLRAASAELLASAPKFRNEHVSRFFQFVAKKRRPIQMKKASNCSCKTCRGEDSDAGTPNFSFAKAAKIYEAEKKQREQVSF